MSLSPFKRIAALMLALVSAPAFSAEITDSAGRKVEIDAPAKRVIVGEARQIHVIAALKNDKIGRASCRERV